MLSAGAPDICFPRDGQDMGVVVFLQLQPPRPIVPLPTLPRDPGGWNARVAGALQHLLRQLGLGRTGALRRHPRALATRFLGGPLFGERECTIQHEMALRTRRGQKYPDVAMFHAARCAALLACHASRLLAFFEKPRLIDDQHGLRRTKMLDHVGSQIVAEGIGIPYSPSQ